ncbi:MAG: DUF4435 domain-containing protein [Bacteroidaceae bacterium]|nr:DUF4435 domain-containing protein [Bacteroidaceae bacterium]
MPSLASYADSRYVAALNALEGKAAPRRVVVYVEGYDDVLFWSALLRPLENGRVRFEVMLPSCTGLGKGKKVALSNELGERLGEYMIACVDADYDYLLEGATLTSKAMHNSPYVFHTYLYAIENYRCYAPALSEVCVSATLNDRRLFDFEAFMAEYSRIVWPLFVWNVWVYRYGGYKQFSLQDFARLVAMPDPNLFHPEEQLAKLRHRVNAKIARLQKAHPEGKKTYKPLRDRLLALGLTPETTYLFIRGHDVQDGLVLPLVTAVCERLRREREREIRTAAVHRTQLQNELAGYQHSAVPPEEVLRRHRAYAASPWYQRVQSDIRAFLDKSGLGSEAATGESAKK